jgi:hypothetical protein
LVGSGKDASLSLAYEKYRAFLDAFQTYETMYAAGTWTLPKLNKIDIIELFISRSFFFSHYRTCFGKITKYPKMAAWLENREEADDGEVWGVQKDEYVFKDLVFWLKNKGTLIAEVEEEEEEKTEKKGKGKKEEGKKNKKKKIQKGGNK